jgi:tricorn protease
LLYRDWLQQTRASVADASDGRIGFLHIRAMGANDIAAFARDFYEHYDKPGLIIDVRGNRGGNIDSWILGLLSRKVWAFWGSSNGAPIATNMQQAFRGHLVVLVDEDTYSDGETFAAGVKALDLAPLIGTTTAGAGIWLSNRSRLVDGGMARIAESAQYGLDGRWLIEGRGVSPDQVVVNEPHALFLGKDRQLDAAIEYLQIKLEEEPIPELKPKPLPELGTNGDDVE